LHNLADTILPARDYDEVHMIGHEYIGMNSAIMTGTGVRQMMPKSTIIFIGNKNRATVVATLDNMLG
jgi:hypothetical protein